MKTTRLFNRVNEISELIAKANKDEVWAIEPDSTWETNYEFISIKLLKTRIAVKYNEYNGIKPKEVLDYALLSRPEDVNYMLSWIKRSIKKGYKESERNYKEEMKLECLSVNPAGERF